MTNIIKNIFKITDFFDKARWKTVSDYSLINYFRNNLSYDEKILTHWICYISDRRTPFRKIWDVGGFIYSNLVHEIKITESFELLNPQYIEKSFIISNKKDKKKISDKKERYMFTARTIVNDNSILLNYGFQPNEFPTFTPRYYPADYFSILGTFDILKDKRFEFSFIKYIKYILNIIDDDKDSILSKLLFSLYLLTYHNIGQPRSSNLKEFAKNLEIIEERTTNIKEIISNEEKFKDEYKKFQTSKKRFNQKRAWCALRDYIKSPEFKNYFFNSLKEEGYDKIDLLRSESLLPQLELPGDTWNNNPKFLNCILRNTSYKDLNMNSPELIRKIYNEEQIEIGYPEIFDITFNFVPRMCENNNCSICPYGVLLKNVKDFTKICVNNPEKYCTVVLTCCNYKIKCFGEKCELLKALF